jgi:hypothetical protein
MARIRGTKNKRTLLREAELEAIRAGTKKDVLTSIYVIMEYFFFRAKGMRAVGNHDKAERYYLRALTAAEKIAPYKYARLSAVKVMGDPNAQKDFEDGATLEELKAMVEFHLERVAPMLDRGDTEGSNSESAGWRRSIGQREVTFTRSLLRTVSNSASGAICWCQIVPPSISAKPERQGRMMAEKKRTAEEIPPIGRFEGKVDHLNGSLTKWMGAALLVAASALFVAAEVSINAVNGWWSDELTSLWASDVSLPFTRAFSERIAPDANPPLYYAVLYWVRWLINDDRTAVLAVNIAAIMVAAGAVFVASRRAGLSRLAVCGIAAFGLSGPVLMYASEGRAYCLALAVVFVASWYAALAIKHSQQRSVLASFIALGALAGLTHVYAALLCGGLGAGLLTVASFSRRKDLVGPGLALGLSTGVVFAIWLSMGRSSLKSIGWIKFSSEAVFDAARYAGSLAVGWHFNLLFLILLAVFGIFDRATAIIFHDIRRSVRFVRITSGHCFF